MTGKKKKKASDDLVHSVLDELNSDVPSVEGPLVPGITGESGAFGNAVLGAESGANQSADNQDVPVSPYSENFHPDRELPSGIDSKTAVYSPPTSTTQFGEVPPPNVPQMQDKTAVIQSQETKITEATAYTKVVDGDKTVVVGVRQNSSGAQVEEKVSFGAGRTSRQAPAAGIGTHSDAQIMQAENLKMAQDRILALEKENEKIREENEVLSSASDLAREKNEELIARLNNLERAKAEQYDQAQAEIDIYKDSVNEKDKDLIKLRNKVEELESRLKTDLRKIRVRERELENRLELAKLEKNALIKAKDDIILELKRNLDKAQSEIDSYKGKSNELAARIESTQVQLGRTVRALRLALANLEASEQQDNLSVTPLKKAE